MGLTLGNHHQRFATFQKPVVLACHLLTSAPASWD